MSATKTDTSMDQFITKPQATLKGARQDLESDNSWTTKLNRSDGHKTHISAERTLDDKDQKHMLRKNTVDRDWAVCMFTLDGRVNKCSKKMKLDLRTKAYRAKQLAEEKRRKEEAKRKEEAEHVARLQKTRNWRKKMQI